jgi:archaellum component FlaG (FlaF/FlaG flagellin family)
MKVIKYAQLFLGIALAVVVSSCVKEEYPPMGDAGTSFAKFSESPENKIFLSPFSDKRKVTMFTVTRDVKSNSDLERPGTISIKYRPDLLEEYNEEHETDYEAMPADLYTLVNENFTKNGDVYTVNYDAGDFAQTFSIEIDGNKFDASKKYAFVMEITDPGDLKVKSGSEIVYAFVSLKNQWDGRYLYTTSGATALVPNQEANVTLETVNATKVQLKPGLLATYSNEVFYIIDPATNKVTVEMTSLLPIATDASSHYDPDTKTFHLKWTSNGGARLFEETFKFTGERN